MHKKVLNFSKISTLGIIWLVAFLHLYQILGKYRWNFDIMNGKHWHKILVAWQKGWVIDTIEEWAFVLFILSSVPIFFATFAVILKKDTFQMVFNFLKKVFIAILLVKIFSKIAERSKAKKKARKKHKIKNAVSVIENSKEYIPQSISLARKEESVKKYNKKEDNVPSGSESITARHHEATHHSHAVSGKENEKKSKIDDILSRLEGHQKKHQEKKTSSSNKKIDEKLKNNFKNKGYSVLENIKISDDTLSFLALGQNKIIVGEILDKDAEWVADEKSLDGMPAMWTSSVAGMRSPVQKVISARRQLKKDLIDIIENESVEAVVCLTKGKIDNLDDVKSKWRRESVVVVNASKEAKTPFLKNLNDFISEKTPPMKSEKIEKIKKKLKIS